MRNSKKTIDSQIIQLYRKVLKNCRNSSVKLDTTQLKFALTIANDNYEKLPTQNGKHQVVRALEISEIISGEFGLGTSSIISALLFDYLAAGIISRKEIEEKFGDKVAEICDGLSRITSIKSDKTSTQAENLRNLILTLARDVRVILVKLAERLYLLRNLEDFEREDQIHISSEAKYIHSPLAHRRWRICA